jgi:hypothetical protein
VKGVIPKRIWYEIEIDRRLSGIVDLEWTKCRLYKIKELGKALMVKSVEILPKRSGSE